MSACFARLAHFSPFFPSFLTLGFSSDPLCARFLRQSSIFSASVWGFGSGFFMAYLPPRQNQGDKNHCQAVSNRGHAQQD
jgi:hypothetical protein